MIIKFVSSIVISAIISFITTPLVRRYFVSRSWIEDPAIKQQKTHNATALTALPRGGGLPIFIAVISVSLLFLPLDKHLVGILIASFLTLFIGLVDDVKDISPKFRIVTNLIAALIVVGSGIGIAYISSPFGGIIDLSAIQFNFNFIGQHSIWLLSDTLAIIWIIWCMNITGWSAGVEGQLPGFVAISAMFIGILGLRYSTDATQWPVIILAGTVAGAYLGFLPFNLFPQSIMVGYSGKSLAGFFLAVLAILSGAKLATLILLLGIPMIDAIFILVRRLITHRPIMVSDGPHLHHRLLKIGWSRVKIAVFYWIVSFVLGIISLFLNSQQKFYVFIGLVVLFFSLLFELYFKTSKDKDI
jgi:UDP-GlcNAc:undecaprenyl-phosphate/decaprenyl-phosphate GlcNAc-1-phosphate transferase